MRKYLFMIGALVLTAAFAFGAVACGDDDDEDGGNGGTPVATEPEATEPAGTTPDASPSANTIDVNLIEYTVDPDPDTATAGSVTFNARNTGAEEHELVVIRTDLDSAGLPTAEDGSVDEAGEGIDVIGEIEEFAPGDEQTASFELEAGAYVLICNVVEEHEGGELRVHYEEGMHVAFTVTE